MEIDFTTALGRLLRDSALREAFSRDPAAVANDLKLCASDRTAFINLSAGEIESQARLLLQKRFAEIRKLAPLTCHLLGADAWSSFARYAPANWFAGHQRHLCDARTFCERALIRDQAELNRLRFALDTRRIAVHAVADLRVKARTRRALQILTRARSGGIRERAFFLAP